jgi:hypothetical protein
MNDARRIKITAIVNILQEAHDNLDDIKAEEEEFLDNMPEGVKSGDQGTKAAEAVDRLDDAITSLEQAISECESAVG